MTTIDSFCKEMVSLCAACNTMVEINESLKQKALNIYEVVGDMALNVRVDRACK